jgi:hypothetical protein
LQSKSFFTRRDGVLIYSNDKKNHAQSASALIGGVWQAAEALMQIIPNDGQQEMFRLSYDTSSQGLFIHPVSINNEQYYLGVTYVNTLNPGHLKMKIKHTALRLSEFIIKKGEQKVEVINDEEFLFKDISDEEMDRVFSFVRD